jgi:LPXTG-site transpeptidase (sortase) family protein
MSSSQSSKTVTKHQLVSLYRQAVAAGLPVDLVHQKIKNYSERSQLTLTIEEQDDQKQIKSLQKKVPLRTRIIIHLLPVVCVSIGFFLVSNAIWPIISYFMFTSPELADGALLSPIPKNAILEGNRSLVNQVQAQEFEEPDPTPTILAEDLDYSNLNNWFPNLTADQAEELAQSDQAEKDGKVIEEYTIDIPAVNIENAKVKVGGTNLDKSLIQYPGTAAPGEPGAPVIFGHSVLRQFYNPSVKNPRRYMSIFSKIMTLKPGDKIYITENDVKYTYVVEEKTEVKPTDTFILEQNYDQERLKLITCVPEGTYLRRGVIIARLEK